VTVKSSVARYEGTGLRFTATTGSGHAIVLDDGEGNTGRSVAAMLSAGTVEIHHRYRILGAGGAAPIEGDVLVTGPGADVDQMGRRQASGSAA
jgi:hypothetical protein